MQNALRNLLLNKQKLLRHVIMLVLEDFNESLVCIDALHST